MGYNDVGGSGVVGGGVGGGVGVTGHDGLLIVVVLLLLVMVVMAVATTAKSKPFLPLYFWHCVSVLLSSSKAMSRLRCGPAAQQQPQS